MKFESNKIRKGFRETTSSGTLLTLVFNDLDVQYITGSVAQNIKLPNAQLMGKGTGFLIVNSSTATATVYLNDGTTILTTIPAGAGYLILRGTAITTNGTWKIKSGGIATAAPGFGATPPGATLLPGNSLGIMGGGNNTSVQVALIDYFNFASTAVYQNFGNLSQARADLGACSSNTRGVFAGGGTAGGNVSTIDYITINTPAPTASAFGNLTAVRVLMRGCGNQTRGLFPGGYNGSVFGNVEYITIATTGNALNFGALTQPRGEPAAFASPLYGVFAGGFTGVGTPQATIDFVAIATTAAAAGYASLSQTRYGLNGGSNATIGISCGGITAGSTYVKTTDFINIGEGVNAAAFGNLTVNRYESATSSSLIKLTVNAGYDGASFLSSTEFITYATLTEAALFSTISSGLRYSSAGCSNCHGGL